MTFLPSFRIKPWALFGLILLLAGAPSSRAAAPILEQWIAVQTNVTTWTAEVLQTRTLKALAQPLTSTGHVWFAAPNQFRWELGTPAQTIAVRQAGQMLVIYPRLKRVEKYPLTGAATGQWREVMALLEAGFPRSVSDIDRTFNLTQLQTNNLVCEATLQPKSAGARRMMPQIKIAFSTTNFTLRSTELQFADGSTLRNDFLNSQLNPVLDPATFQPPVPADYKIVEPLKHP